MLSKAVCFPDWHLSLARPVPTFLVPLNSCSLGTEFLLDPKFHQLVWWIAIYCPSLINIIVCERRGTALTFQYRTQSSSILITVHNYGPLLGKKKCLNRGICFFWSWELQASTVCFSFPKKYGPFQRSYIFPLCPASCPKWLAVFINFNQRDWRETW